MKKYKVSLIFEEDYWPWTYIVEANNFQEALKEASKRSFASDEDITRVEIVEVKRGKLKERSAQIVMSGEMWRI